MPKRTSFLIQDQFNTNFTPESSYVLGILFADGCITKNCNEIRISCLSNDMQQLIPTFQKVGKWNILIRKETKKYGRNDKEQTILTCSDEKMHDTLSESDDFLLDKIPDSLKKYWYRGYIDGDGCWRISQAKQFYKDKIYIVYNRNMTITGPIDQNWNFFITLLNNLNIKFNISKYNKTNKYSQLTVTSRENYLKLGNYLYDTFEKDNIGLQRKCDKWKEIVNSY